MADCCENKACALEALRERQSATLKIVLVINAVMFVVELIAGMMAGSTALLSDDQITIITADIQSLADNFSWPLSLRVELKIISAFFLCKVHRRIRAF